MNFDLVEDAGFAEQVRDFVERHVTPEVVDAMHQTGTMHAWTFHRALAETGWIQGPGAGSHDDAATPFRMAAVLEQLGFADAPFYGLGNAMLAAAMLEVVGAQGQHREVVRRIYAGEVVVCLGYSEPNSGSDVAAASTAATRDGDVWHIDGQKIFTTLAEVSEFMMLLARTDPAVPKHQGLTMFLVPMATEGIEVRPIRTLSGERTNEVFFTDVVVHDDCRLGEVNGGWDVLATGLSLERGLFGPPTEGARLLARSVEWAGEADEEGRRPLDQPMVRARLARVAVTNEVARMLALQAIWVHSTGASPGVEGAMAKLFSSEAFQRTASDLLDVVGASGAVSKQAPGTPGDGWLEQAYRHAAVTTIYGGTSEILRSIIGERFLGLPRSR